MATVAEQAGSTARLRAGSALHQAPAARRRARAGSAREQPARTRLRLIAIDGRVVRPAPGELVRTSPAAATAPRQPAATRPARAPVRLTRRGRLVVTAVSLLAAAAASVGLAGAAQALGHSGTQARPGTTAGITKVEVRPGQSLWTLAEAYDPNADTRQVIQEILQLNSMSSDQVQPGQVLWMPRG